MAGVVTARTAVVQYLLRGESWAKEIMRGIRDLAGMTVSDNSVYPILEALVMEGLATRRVSAPPAGTRTGQSIRYYYTLTDAGKEHAVAIQDQVKRVLRMSITKSPDVKTNSRRRGGDERRGQ